MEESIHSKIKTVNENENEATFEIEPLEPGFGHTVGNSLRRVLLSSLGGSAITEIKIEGATHEFTTLEHAKDDVLQIILNLKDLKVKLNSNEAATLKLKSSKTGKVTAADFEKNANVEIINPEQPITSLDKNGKFDLEVIVENGRGFIPTEDREKSKKYGYINIDAIFTPVEAVNYRVENTRVGQMTNYDKLIITVKTNGIKSSIDCLKESIQILVNQFSLLLEDKTEKIAKEPKSQNEVMENLESLTIDSKTKISDLGLSSRTVNALLNAGVKTYGGIKRLSDLKISEIKGLGGKGLDEIRSLISE